MSINIAFSDASFKYQVIVEVTLTFISTVPINDNIVLRTVGTLIKGV